MEYLTNLAAKVTDLFDGEAPKKTEDLDDDALEQQLANEKHRYDSFAAVRHGAQVKFYVDGQNYCW